MAPKKHWLDRAMLTCGLCGKVSRTLIDEAYHRHNAPFLCRRKKEAPKRKATETEGTV